MRKKRKTEITLELREAVAIRPQRNLVAHCRECRKQTRIVAANEAATLARLRAREVYRFVEAGQLHFTEDQGGLLYVCLDSLQELVSKRDKQVETKPKL